ncbi:MAG: N-6 DNA methylase [Clostridia bacterium]|nr:N-6 DNA methylase [Clostridia bacterium]
MESVIKDPRLKGKCQTFTPENFVSLMLDLAGYKDALLGKRILENCCGDGQFLVQIVKRYIEAALREGYSNREIAKGLETDIFAYEIDEVLVNKCKERLNAIVHKYDLEAINWHIGCKDYLSQEVCGAFDFIVGNPPYIAYQDLPAELRIELKNNFKVCKKGKFDYCYK